MVIGNYIYFRITNYQYTYLSDFAFILPAMAGRK